MPIDLTQLAKLNEDYLATTGKPVAKFVCPITLDDDPQAELCDGHILNKSIKSASRATVIQRKDVDNFYGRTIEPHLLRLLNTPVSTPQELLRAARDLTITTPDGESREAFFADSKARQRFQQVDLRNKDGSHFASPFLKTGELGPEPIEDLQIKWTMSVIDSAVEGALIKSAYLALYRMLRYQWVLSADGDKVRRALADFYLGNGTAETARDYFADFSGAAAVLENDAPEDVDTLRTGSLLLHYAEGDRTTGILFGVTCFFKVNHRLMTVTLPCHQKSGYYFVAFDHYQRFLQSTSTTYTTHFARFADRRFAISKSPLPSITRARGAQLTDPTTLRWTGSAN